MKWAATLHRRLSPRSISTNSYVKRQRQWRYALNSTSTHDTKRGEDVRARINVLSEIPGKWQRHLNAWAKWNASKKEMIASHAVPDRNEEVFLYQTLIGAWPLADMEMLQFRERLEAYMLKAIREAMVHTRWSKPNSAHERAVVKFLRAILEPRRDNLFLDDFLKFQRNIALLRDVERSSTGVSEDDEPGSAGLLPGM